MSRKMGRNPFEKKAETRAETTPPLFSASVNDQVMPAEVLMEVPVAADATVDTTPVFTLSSDDTSPDRASEAVELLKSWETPILRDISRTEELLRRMAIGIPSAAFSVVRSACGLLSGARGSSETC